MKEAQRLIKNFLEKIISQIPYDRLSEIGCRGDGPVLCNCLHNRDKYKCHEKSSPAAGIHL